MVRQHPSVHTTHKALSRQHVRGSARVRALCARLPRRGRLLGCVRHVPAGFRRPRAQRGPSAPLAANGTDTHAGMFFAGRALQGPPGPGIAKSLTAPPLLWTGIGGIFEITVAIKPPCTEQERFWAVWDPYQAHAKSQYLRRSRSRALTAQTWPVGACRDGTCAEHGQVWMNFGDCERTLSS